MLLFRQTAGTYQAWNQWYSHNPTKPDDDNFSQLYRLNDCLRGQDGKFTFKILWPENKSKVAKNYNVWKQMSNPLWKVTDYTKRVVGYEAVDVTNKD